MENFVSFWSAFGVVDDCERCYGEIGHIGPVHGIYTRRQCVPGKEEGVQNKGNWDISLFLDAKMKARKQYKAIFSLHPLFLKNGFLSSIMNARIE